MMNVHTETQEQAEARWAAARARLNYVPETRDAQVARMERDGLLDPACTMCQSEVYARTDTMPCDVFAPRHQASSRCESGKRAHCTCDTCFTVLWVVLSLVTWTSMIVA